MEQVSIWPEGESLRNAVRWLAQQQSKDLATIEEACRRYNLSPADEEFLLRHFTGPGSSGDTDRSID
jgi:hypothetical protein